MLSFSGGFQWKIDSAKYMINFEGNSTTKQASFTSDPLNKLLSVATLANFIQLLHVIEITQIKVSISKIQNT